MKPAVECLRTSSYVVLDYPRKEICDLIRQYHYSKSCSNTSVFCHALMRLSDLKIVGGALWLPPTAKAAKGLAKKRLGCESKHRQVLCLSRLVVAEGEPKNAAGFLLGRSERLVWQDERWNLLVTYADLGQGHQGTIYRATNWIFDGFTKSRANWVDPLDGKMVSQSSGQDRFGITRKRTKETMLSAGYVVTDKSSKARFYKVRK